MNRRELLAGAGAALGAALAGCSSLLGESGCEPAEAPIGGVDASRPVEESDREYAVRGTMVASLDSGIMLDDGTGKAAVTAGSAMNRINDDLVSVGDCIAATGSLDAEATRQHGMAVLTVDRADFGVLTGSSADVEPMGDHPVPEFAANQPSGDSLRLTVREPDGATAGNVFAAYGTQAGQWSALDDATGPDEPLRDGASIAVDGVADALVSMQWRSPDRTWARCVAKFRGP